MENFGRKKNVYTYMPYNLSTSVGVYAYLYCLYLIKQESLPPCHHHKNENLSYKQQTVSTNIRHYTDLQIIFLKHFNIV